MASNLLLHMNCLLPALVDTRRLQLASSALATPRTLSSDLVIRFLVVFLCNSSTKLAHWCNLPSGPFDPFVHAFESSPFLCLSDSTTPNLCPSCLSLSPCFLPYVLPFLAFLFPFQSTTLPLVHTVHSCNRLSLTTRNSLLCVLLRSHW